MKCGLLIIAGIAGFGMLLAGGCGKTTGYSNEWLYPQNVETVYVEMFENDTFRRGLEYDLSDAVAKRIEAETPYKIVSDRDIADTVLSGKIVGWTEDVISFQRQIGRPLELEAQVRVLFNWKNLKTGEYIAENKMLTDAMTFSPWLNQSYEYGSAIAANRLAERIVEQMQTKW